MKLYLFLRSLRLPLLLSVGFSIATLVSAFIGSNLSTAFGYLAIAFAIIYLGEKD